MPRYITTCMGPLSCCWTVERRWVPWTPTWCRPCWRLHGPAPWTRPGSSWSTGPIAAARRWTSLEGLFHVSLLPSLRSALDYAHSPDMVSFLLESDYQPSLDILTRQLRISPDNARAILATCLRVDERENLVVMDLRMVSLLKVFFF